MAFTAGSTYKIENISTFLINDALYAEGVSGTGESIKDGISIVEGVSKSVNSAAGSTRKTSEKGEVKFELFFQDLSDADYTFLKANNGLECVFRFVTTNETQFEFHGILNMNESIKTNDVLTLPIEVTLESGDIDDLIVFSVV